MDTPTVNAPPTPTRDFHLGDILSVTTGYLVSPTDFGAVHELIEFLAGEPIFTHALPRFADGCRDALLAQHPQLADVDMSGITIDNLDARLSEQVARFGAYLPVRQIGTSNL